MHLKINHRMVTKIGSHSIKTNINDNFELKKKLNFNHKIRSSMFAMINSKSLIVEVTQTTHPEKPV